MNLTASTVDAFDDWFAELDDGDLDLPPADAKKAIKSSKNRQGDLQDSWVEDSDDEDEKNTKKNTSPRKELKARKSGDLERMFAAAASAKKEVTKKAPKKKSTAPDVKKPVNKAMEVLNKEEKKKARSALDRRRTAREEMVKRRNSITQCVERQLSGSSCESGGSINDKLSSPRLRHGPKKVLTPPRPKKSPIRSKSDAVKPMPLSALYGTPACGDSLDATEPNTSDEGSSNSVKPEEQKTKLEQNAHCDVSKQQLPPRRSPSVGGLRERSRDPLPRSRHGAYGRSSEMDSSRRGAARDSRRSTDPLSRSTHAPSTSRDRSLGRSRHGASRASSVGPSRRRKSPQDPLSRSSHGAPRPSRGASNGPSRRHYREDDQQRGGSISRSSHGTSRSTSLGDSRRSTGLSLSSHGPSRHRSHEESCGPRRMPIGGSSRSSDPSRYDQTKSPSRSRSSTRPSRRSHDKEVPRTLSDTDLENSSSAMLTPVRTNEAELLRAAINMLQEEHLALPSVGPREGSQRRERSHNDELRRSSHGRSRRSRTPTRL